MEDGKMDSRGMRKRTHADATTTPSRSALVHTQRHTAHAASETPSLTSQRLFPAVLVVLAACVRRGRLLRLWRGGFGRICTQLVLSRRREGQAGTERTAGGDSGDGAAQAKTGAQREHGVDDEDER